MAWKCGPHTHTPESTHNVPAKQVSWSQIKNFLRKLAKNTKIPFFLLIFVIKDPLKKLEAKQKSKFYFHNFLGNIVVQVHAKYR